MRRAPLRFGVASPLDMRDPKGVTHAFVHRTHHEAGRGALKGAWFQALPYQVKSRFRDVPFKSNLRRYDEVFGELFPRQLSNAEHDDWMSRRGGGGAG
jgi:hypothetical protein